MSVLSIVQINAELMLFLLCISIWILTRVWTKDSRQYYRHIWFIDLLAAGLLLSDIFAIYYRGNTTAAGFYMVRGANFFNFLFLYLMPLYLCFFVQKVFEQPDIGKKRIRAAKILSMTALVLNVVNLFIPFVYNFDAQNRYYRKTGWYFNAMCILIAAVLLTMVIVELKKEVEPGIFWMLLLDIMMPFIASVVQVFIYGIAITNIAIGLTQILLFMIMFRYQEERLRERETQLSEYNAKLMLTQVQPHFMLNTLSTIQYLCKTDSEAAAETISDFGIYLRNNMEFASSTKLISFEKELSHIEKYVSIEQKRFGDRIKVIYDIKEKDFEIPPLSVQPLVENAIKHGISKKRGGGTVELSTLRGVDKIHVIVKDNGIGFDPEKPFTEDRVHLGLSIVKDRLKRMCGGDVMITSEINKGTICEITIPITFS